MKGLIFTEFLELIEEKFGLAMVDEIIEASNLKSEGSYTSVGTYEFSELVQLISNLSARTKIAADDLLLVYAEHLFKALISTHPNLVNHYKDPMELLASIENHIHVEVKKIYPDAELPTFTIEERTATKMTMLYKSDRALYVLGKGLMEQTFKLFNVDAEVSYKKLNDHGTEVKFFVEVNDTSK